MYQMTWSYRKDPRWYWTFGECIEIKTIGNSMQPNSIQKISSRRMRCQEARTHTYHLVLVRGFALVSGLMRFRRNMNSEINSMSVLFAGKKYGVVAMKLIIVYIVRHYRLSTKLKLEDLKFQMQVTLGLLNENVIEIENRDDYWKYVVCKFE